MTTGMKTRFPSRAFHAVGCVLVAATPSAVELEGPEVVKIGWSIGSLAAADIDGDGRTDLAIINNDRAGIEVLIQRRPGSPSNRTRPSGLDRWQPVLEDARFERRGVPTGSRMYALAAGDLDGDGRGSTRLHRQLPTASASVTRTRTAASTVSGSSTSPTRPDSEAPWSRATSTTMVGPTSPY